MQRADRRDGVPLVVQDSAARLQRVDFATQASGGFDEDFVQELLFEHPSCIPMEQIESGMTDLVSVCRELPTPHGFIDNLFMTSSGNIVIAETKLWRNPQARREVIAQALDYASCLFEMTYDQLESAVLKAKFGSRARPVSLYSLFSSGIDAVPEFHFIDAVRSNLRQGRIVVLLVGDGIREEVERIASALQLHSGFHFTFAMVELAIYDLPCENGKNGRLVIPRTLAKTLTVERGIIRIKRDGEVQFNPPSDVASPSSAGTITAEQFLEKMAARRKDLPGLLKQFIKDLGSFGAYPVFGGSLNLRWDPPLGKAISFGYVMGDGAIWTESVSRSAPSRDLAKGYINELAQVWRMKVDWQMYNGAGVVRADGNAPRIEAVADKLDDWARVIHGYIDRLREYYSSQDQ